MNLYHKVLIDRYLKKPIFGMTDWLQYDQFIPKNI